jgi:uncharacterized protein
MARLKYCSKGSIVMQYKIDTHMHLAGTGCCNSGIELSSWFRSRYTFRVLKFILGINDQQLATDIDETWPKNISSMIATSQVDYGVILGFDQVYSHQTGEAKPKFLQLKIPSQWVFQCAKTHPNLLPGPSINPHRRDALEQLEYCIEQKAVLIKWLPCAQDINPGDTKLLEFYRRLARAEIPILVHMGGERTFHTVNPKWNDVELLRMPLSHGVKVICAHTATPIVASRETDQIPALVKLIKEFPHLWVDNSGLLNPGRFKSAPKVAQNPVIRQRTLYGSDWPVPSNAIYFLGKIPLRSIRKLEKIKNYLDRDIETKRALGYDEQMFSNAGKVLANLDHWTNNLAKR